MNELQARLQRILGDDYRVERELSGGGMTRLFLARETSLDRLVVVKLLPPELANDVNAARFQREIHVAANLQHPHILPVLSAGGREGLFYYIMPYIAGESLRERLAREGKLPVLEALRILYEVSDALGFAHRTGIIHRDVKPANILLRDGHAVLTDFGIARALEMARLGPGDEPLTETGFSVGTVGYMAPEQVAGERNLDARVDVYALGVVAYEMFAGEPPFTAPNAQALLVAHLTQRPRAVAAIRPEVPAAVSDAVVKAMAKSRDERFPTAAEFNMALEVALTGSRVAVSAPKGVPLWAVAAGVLLTAGAAGWYAWDKWKEPPLNQNLVAVAPFTVILADSLLGERVADMLAKRFNGAGPLRTVAQGTAFRTWKGLGSHPDRVEFGRNLGAGMVLTGEVIAVSRDSLKLTAQMLDVRRGSNLADAEVSGLADAYPALAESLQVQLLRQMNERVAIAAVRNSSIGSTSMAALKAFLTGEQFYRRSVWDSAVVYYERAVDQDTTFALAYRHAALARRWVRGERDSLSRAYLQRAARFNRGLLARDSLLIVAGALGSALAAFEGDTAYLGHRRHLLATLERAKKDFPDDPEVWSELGDAYFHYAYGPALVTSEDSILGSFQRAIALDSAFAPAYIHAVELGFTLAGVDTGLRYARNYIALAPGGEYADAFRVLMTIVGRDGRGGPERSLDGVSDSTLYQAWTTVRRWADPDTIGVRLARYRAATPARTAQPAQARQFLAQQLTYRGRLGDAYRTIGTNVGGRDARTFAELALLGGVPEDSARAVFRRWLRDESIDARFALPWWATKGDTGAVKAILDRAEAKAAAATTPVDRRDTDYRVRATSAYLALARRDTAEALGRFVALPDTLCLPCYLDRLTKARLLATYGRHDEAARLLTERLYILLTGIEIAFASERARVAERSGRYEEAANAYAVVLRAWSSADTVLQPEVRAARAALDRLAPDGRNRLRLRAAVLFPWRGKS